MSDLDLQVMSRWLELDEGCELRPYACTANKLTIGIGRNLEDVGITREEADFLLKGDMERVQAQLDERFPEWKTLSPVRKMVILNMAFNMGVNGLLQFRKTIAFIQFQLWEDAANEMLNSKWAEQVGARARRLSQAMKTDQLPSAVA